MNWTLLGFFDLIGTIAFAISGSVVAIHKKMDIFGVIVLAVTTACGGGLIRDLVVGHTPPKMFENCFYVVVAVIIANIVFWLVYSHQKMPTRLVTVYDRLLFWFDTFGLAAFTVDGVMVGVDSGFADNRFLLMFLGFITGGGGGAVRDIMADQMPDIFLKHIYASASLSGSIVMIFLYEATESTHIAMIGAFLMILVIRYLAAKYNWNLPKATED